MIIDIAESHLAEIELRESEERLRGLVDTSPDAITVSDLEGNFTMVGMRTAAIHGYSLPDEMIGMSAFDQNICCHTCMLSRLDSRFL
ncbi:MAG: PAS domain S-box protein [Candidatus Thorarchaeota archaeon]